MKRSFLERLLRTCLLLLLLCLALPCRAGAQSFTSRSYTVDHGLPGNNLHCLLQDRRGFIWIGTEDGLARFDGTAFRQYHISDGLPDNEIIALRMDDEGKVWALAFKGPPAVYEPAQDRFAIRMQTHVTVPERSMDALQDGGISVNGGGMAEILNGGFVERLVTGPRHAQLVQMTVALGNARYLLISADSIRLFERGRQTGAQLSPLPPNARATYVSNALYYCDSNGICKAALRGAGGISQMCMARRTIGASRLSFTGMHLALISDNGTAATLIDTATLAEVARLPLNGVLAKDILEDSEGNIWIAGIGQGLIKLSRYEGLSYNSFLPPGMLPGTVAVDGPVLLCGDDKGRIAVFRNGCIERLIDISQWSKAVSRIRSIVVLKDGYYIAVEGDASLLLDKHYNIVSLYNRPWLNYSDRCAALWHDSIILCGSHSMAVRLDYKACHGYDTASIRTTAIGADTRGRLIIGATDGLYRKDDTGIYYFGQQHPELRNRVADICTSPDGLVWAGTAAGHLVALQDAHPAALIRLGKEIPGSVCNTLCAGRAGEIWVGTDAALSRISYVLSEGQLHWKAVSFGASEGITGQVSDIAWQRDTVYVTTGGGVYSFPGQMAPAVKDIPVYITRIRINERDTVLNSSWDLPYTARSWDIYFSGVTMSGYIPSYQYRINGEAWQDIAETHLPLKRLAPGSYTIQIRALKRDGTPSARTATLRIKLRAPFWMSVPFWLLSFALLLGLSIWLMQYLFRRKRMQQLKRIAIENELITSQQQTFSALMNPHFIFNALNSIQHYVLAQNKQAANRYLSGFGRLIRMNFESAQKSYISLEEELERLQLYLSLEQMRFGDKLSYTINVAEDVAPEDWQIPAMIIQPFVENALLHGIAPARISGRLDVIVTCKGQDLYIRICDNGVGLAAGQQQKSTDAHASRSMELIRRRIAVLRKLHKQDIRIEVGANNTADTEHPGTCIRMIFPAHFLG